MMNKLVRVLMAVLFTISICYVVCAEEGTQVGVSQSKHAFGEVPRINAYEAKKLFVQGKLILVNAQEAPANARNMLLGAISAPQGTINGMELDIPENMIVAFYCN